MLSIAVECALKLSRTEAADVLAFALFPFALARILAIFIAIKLKPMHILVVDLTLGLIGNIIFTTRGYFVRHTTHSYIY